MRIYLAGPMTGYEDFNYPAFADAAERMRADGHDVASPHEVDVSDAPESDRTWHLYMRRCLPLLCTCEAVAVLPGWTKSRGASLEVHVARALDMPVLEAATLQPFKARGWWTP